MHLSSFLFKKKLFNLNLIFCLVNRCFYLQSLTRQKLLYFSSQQKKETLNTRENLLQEKYDTCAEKETQNCNIVKYCKSFIVQK